MESRAIMKHYFKQSLKATETFHKTCQMKENEAIVLPKTGLRVLRS